MIRRTVGIGAAYVLLTLLGFGCSPDRDRLSKEWMFAADSAGTGEQEAWYAPGFDRSGWKEVRVPGMWDDFGYETYDGAGWYAARRDWPSSSGLSLVFLGVDDQADVWVNGTYLGSHVVSDEPFSIDVPDSLRSASMLVVVRVTDRGGPGGLHKDVLLASSGQAEELMRSPYATMDARPSESWVRDAVIYEVYLRSFSPEGTFAALQQRLPELKQLGVTVIWLMPIQPIGELNRKGRLGSPYAIADYKDVNREFGTLEDVRKLVAAVHDAGMHIILDLVANHTAWDNPLLIEHPDWYTRDAEGAIVSPNADWSDVADLDYDRHELRKYMIDVMDFWVRDVGFDGYRCDVAELVPTDFWEHARHELDDIKPVMMLSEGNLPEHHLRAFDLTYAWSTYDMLDPLFSGTVTTRIIPTILRNEARRFPRGALRMRFHTNHDKNAWDAPAVVKWGKAGVKLASTVMYVLPGVPMLYNGEEVGNDKRLPLFEAVPIEWQRGADLRAHFEKLGALRARFPWLATGGWREVPQQAGSQTILIMRTGPQDGQALLACLNFGNGEADIDIPIPEEFKDRMLEDLFSSVQLPPSDRLTLSLPPRGYSIVMVR